jgi:hypothetical protein
MFAREFRPARLLRTLYGTEPFLTYCRLRAIPFDHAAAGADLRGWAAAVSKLPSEVQARVELELAQVNELSGRDGIAHLLEAAGDGKEPPLTVPAGPPLALWFLVHRPDLFQEVFFHHEVRETHSWRCGSGPRGLPADDLERKADALRDALRRFFKLGEQRGPFAAVETHRLPEATCFAARVADRLHLIEGFGESGRPSLQRVRPALAVLFAYYPATGSVLLKSPLRAAERVRALFHCFGRAVLGANVEPRAAAFDLEPLKRPFRPLPDRHDLELVRVKSLHLRYPARLGRRQVKLETLSSDEPAAIEQLLRAHVPEEAASELIVCHAELQVRLRTGGRSRSYVVHLWPDRSSLNTSPLGGRLRECLRRWGLSDAR